MAYGEGGINFRYTQVSLSGGSGANSVGAGCDSIHVNLFDFSEQEQSNPRGRSFSSLDSSGGEFEIRLNISATQFAALALPSNRDFMLEISLANFEGVHFDENILISANQLRNRLIRENDNPVANGGSVLLAIISVDENGNTNAQFVW
jgi:hypothetical protein